MILVMYNKKEVPDGTSFLLWNLLRFMKEKHEKYLAYVYHSVQKWYIFDELLTGF